MNTMMGNDSLSPITPARINVLLVPAGNVKRSRFDSFVSRLAEINEVRLGDVNPNAGQGNGLLDAALDQIERSADAVLQWTRSRQ